MKQPSETAPIREDGLKTFLFLTPILGSDQRIAETLSIDGDAVEILTVNLISEAEYQLAGLFSLETDGTQWSNDRCLCLRVAASIRDGLFGWASCRAITGRIPGHTLGHGSPPAARSAGETRDVDLKNRRQKRTRVAHHSQAMHCHPVAAVGVAAPDFVYAGDDAASWEDDRNAGVEVELADGVRRISLDDLERIKRELMSFLEQRNPKGWSGLTQLPQFAPV